MNLTYYQIKSFCKDIFYYSVLEGFSGGMFVGLFFGSIFYAFLSERFSSFYFVLMVLGCMITLPIYIESRKNVKQIKKEVQELLLTLKS